MLLAKMHLGERGTVLFKVQYQFQKTDIKDGKLPDKKKIVKTYGYHLGNPFRKCN